MGGPEGGQGVAEEAGVAGGGQPGVQDRDHAPVVLAAEQAAGALGEQQGGVGGRHGHEAVAALGGDVALAGRAQRIVRAGERDAVDDDQPQGRPRHVHALPEGEGAEQAGRLVLGEPLDQQHRGVVALAEQGHAEPLPERLGGGLGGAHRGEQAQGPASRGLDQLGDLLKVDLGQAVAARLRQVPGDVEDAAARVVEGRADVQTGPAGPPVLLVAGSEAPLTGLTSS